MAEVRFNSAHWMLIALFAMPPTAALAQQAGVEQSATQRGQVKAQAAETKQEELPKKAEPAEATTGAVPKNAEETPAKKENDARVISGMSILGNQEAPKALVIVPWKSSEIGNSM